MRAVRADIAIMAATAAALLGLAGCADDPDVHQASLYGLAAVALADPAPIRVKRQTTLAVDADGEPGIRIDIEDAAPRWLECRFAPGGNASAPDLVRIDTDRGRLPDPNLFVLKRFWLEAPDSAPADPAIEEEARRLPAVPAVAAYALQQILASLPNAAVYALLAAAFSLIYGLSGRINLAFGGIAAVGGMAAMLGVAALGTAPAAVLLLVAAMVGIVAAGLHGWVIERVVLWRLRRSSAQQGLVATIGLALVLEEYLRLSGGSQPRWIAEIMGGPIGLARAPGFSVTVTPIALVLGGLAMAVSGCVLALLRFSGFGRDWRATADDAVAAALFGVDPKRLAARTFALASGLAGLAGAIVTVFYGSISTAYTTTLGLKALIAAIVGGIGSIPGAFLGGLAIAMTEAAWSAYFPIVYRDLVVESLLIVVLVFRPGGFFGYRDLLPRRV